jgi:thioester reductase-like protein
MRAMHGQIFITGGTGLVGSFLVPRLLRAFPDASIVLLVRASSKEILAGKMCLIVDFCRREAPESEPGRRLEGIAGDVTLPDLGLPPPTLDHLLASTTHIIHGAAAIRFDQRLEEAREVNVRGTERVLALAERAASGGMLQRFLYIGTSSVSGRRGGTITEGELRQGQQFFNTYEQSKCESEHLVRSFMDRIPVTIVRPSIVVGDSRTGRTTSFNVIYLPLRLFQKGLLDVLPGTPDTLLDLVPVDWVDDAITWLLRHEGAAGAVCHLTAGPLRAVPLGTLIRAAGEFFDRVTPLQKPRRVTFADMEEFRQRIARAGSGAAALLKQLETLVPYVTVNRLFDTTTTERLLKGSGITFPLFSEYAERMLGYCVATNWGKRPGDA